MREITYTKEARGALRRMPTDTRRLIVSKIEQYATDPESLRNNVKALKGEPGYLRLCIGDWRGGIFRGHEIVAIIEVAPRGSAY